LGAVATVDGGGNSRHAGLLVIEPTPLTGPTVLGIACGTAEGADASEAMISPKGAV